MSIEYEYREISIPGFGYNRTKRNAFVAADTARKAYWGAKSRFGVEHRTFGVCYALLDPETREIPLVQQSYNSVFSLPGGGLRLPDQIKARHKGLYGEVYDMDAAKESAERELEEELGIPISQIRNLGYLGTSVAKVGSHEATDHIFGGLVNREETKFTIAAGEISRVQWFDADNLPENVYHTVEPGVEAIKSAVY